MANNNAINKQTEDLTINKASGDPFIVYQIAGADKFSIGVDDTDSDSLKITDGANPSAGNTTWKMTNTGERTLPLQPAFSATLSADAANVTGNATVYTIICDTERFDQNADYASGTGTFTAPVTGRYRFTAYALLDDIISTHTLVHYRIVTSNLTYYPVVVSPYKCTTPEGYFNVGVSCLADMDAADTCTFAIVVYSGTKTVDVLGTESYTNFSGQLEV